MTDHILHQSHQLLLGVCAAGAAGAGVLVAAMIMGMLVIMIVRMRVLMRMGVPVGMGMLVGVHGFVVMHNSVPFRRRPEKGRLSINFYRLPSLY